MEGTNTFFEDLVRDLTDVIKMENGEIPVTEIQDFPARTYRVAGDSCEADVVRSETVRV